MKILWLKKISFPILMLALFTFSSCDSIEKQENTADSDLVVANDEAGDVDESADYSLRKQKAEENIDHQIARYISEKDSLQNQDLFDESDKAKTDQRINVLDKQIKFLREQKKIIESGSNDQSVLDSIEANLQEVLEDEVETRVQDRTGTVRGEGTALDGPEINETGTRTGTEVEIRQKSIVESIDQADTADEDQR